MHIVKRIVILMCIFSVSFSLLAEGAKTYENDCNMPDENYLFVNTFVDDSVDVKYLNKWQCIITKKALLSSLESLIKAKDAGLVNKAAFDLKNENVNLVAIWRAGDKVVLSILSKREWHIGLDFNSLNQGVVSVINLTPIDPSTGVE